MFEDRRESKLKRDKTVTLSVKLQTCLGGGDSTQHGQAVDSALDVGSGSILVRQHLGDTRDLIARRNDQRDHGGSVSAESLFRQLILAFLHSLHIKRVAEY